jgi:polysaccharide deacetylase 2 family uncharacterized protein YibQ
MKILLYTATAFFIVLAGVFTFYGLRGPDQPGGAKVVLSIDSRAAPGGATGSAAEPERDVYAAARQQGTEVAAAEDDADVNGDRLGAAPDRQEVRSVDRREVASSGAAQRGKPPAKGQSEDVAHPPPGAAFAGLDHDKPLLNSIGQGNEAADASVSDTQLDAAPAQGLAADAHGAADVNGRPSQADPADAQKESASEASANAAGLRLRQDGGAESASGADAGQKPVVDAVLAALTEREGQAEAAASTAPPPPLPLRRSSAKTAAVNGGGSTKITPGTNAAAGVKAARIAILLRGVGRDDRNSGDAVSKLAPAISFAFTPFSGAAQPWARKAAEQGHEIIVQLPFEPSDYPITNPGPETLLASSAPEQNASRLGAILARFEGYSGVTNFLGGRLLQSKNALRPILEDIKSRGLIYIGEGNNDSHAVVRGLAGEIGLRYAGANVMIDAQPTPAAIQAALERLVAISRKDGTAIGLGYASRATIEQLDAWSQTLAAQGVTLVPVGTLAQTPGAS